MDSISVSELKELDVSHDLIVNNSKIIVNGLIEDHVVNELLDLFSFGSDSLDSIHINVLQQLINPLVAVDLLNEGSKELDQRLVEILDTEEKAIEEGHWILLNVSRMLADAVNDFKVQGLLSFGHLSA